MNFPSRSWFQRAGLTVLLCVGSGFLGVDRWDSRLDIALVAVSFVIGWIPGALCLTTLAASHFIQNHSAAVDLGSFLVVAVGGLLAGTALRRRHSASTLPRRAALSFPVLAVLAAAIAAVQTAIQSAGFAPSTWGTEYLHTAVGLLAACVVVSLPWPGTDGSPLWAPALALFVSFLVVVLTVSSWDRQDAKALRTAAEATAFSFNTNVSDEINVLATKANTSNVVDFDPATFADLVQTVVYGHDPITAAALVDARPGSNPEVLVALSDYGQVFEESLSTWLAAQTGAEFSRLASSGSTVFLDLVTFATPTGELHPQLVYAAPLTPGGLFDPERPRLLVVTVSIPIIVARALSPSTTASDEVALTLYDISSTEPLPIWTTATSGSNTAVESIEDAVPRGAPGTVSAELMVDRFTFEIALQRGERFGTPITTRRLFLVVELLAGVGVFILLLQVGHDRARRELDRRRREALLAAALEGAPGWTAIIDSDDRVLVGNNHTTGAPPGSLVVDTPIWAQDEATTHKVLSLLDNARQGHADSITITITPPEAADLQSLRIYEVFAHLISDSAQDNLVFVQCIDVTERREIAMRTAQAERMESIGVLAGSLAHDFNNLLFITQGYLQMMERQPAVANDPQLNRFVAKASDAVHRGATIAKSLLAVARSQPMTSVSLNMNQFVADLNPLLQQALSDSPGIRLHTELVGSDLDVVVDPGRLSSAVLNLVFNAREAMEHGGDLTIVAERTRATDPAGDVQDVVALSVRDTGTGMTPEVAARAFEPFFTTGKIGKGTGLGLAAVYSFAQQSGGWTAIDTREGVGTTMSIFLKPAVPHPDHAPATLPVALTRLRALVVDDEESIADLVGAWLSELGFDTRRATDSATALEIAKEFQPHLLLSDSNLGEAIDGAELAARITSDLPTLVTVFMTGFSDRLRALETVGALTLVKPFSKDDLNAALIKVLGARLAASAPTGAGPL